MNPLEQFSKKTLYIFRHGETDWNRERRLQGNTDIPLNETGRAQALRLREFFRSNPVEVFVSSDLGRAKETAEIARGAADVPILIEAGLRETNLGEAEGLTQPEIVAKFGPHAWEAWYEIGPDARQFRFPRGETKKEHLLRVFEALERFVASTRYEKIGVATHGGVLRRLIHHWRPELTEPVMIPNCAVYEVTFETGSGLWAVNLEVKCTS